MARIDIPATPNWRDAIRRYSASGAALGAEGTWVDPTAGAQLVVDVADLLANNAPAVPAIMRYGFTSSSGAGVKNLYVGIEDGTLCDAFTLLAVFIQSSTSGSLTPDRLNDSDSGIFVTPTSEDPSNIPSGTSVGPGSLQAGFGSLGGWVDGVADAGSRPGTFFYRHPLSVPALADDVDLQAIFFNPAAPVSAKRVPGRWTGMCLSLDYSAIASGETVTMGCILDLEIPPNIGR